MDVRCAMDENKRLRRPSFRPEKQEAVSVGEIVKRFMCDRVSPQYERSGSVFDIWTRLLPQALAGHCRIDGVCKGELKVLVDSPSYMHELRFVSAELLKELQHHCPNAGIRKIKIAIG